MKPMKLAVKLYIMKQNIIEEAKKVAKNSKNMEAGADQKGFQGPMEPSVLYRGCPE